VDCLLEAARITASPTPCNSSTSTRTRGTAGVPERTIGLDHGVRRDEALLAFAFLTFDPSALTSTSVLDVSTLMPALDHDAWRHLNEA